MRPLPRRGESQLVRPAFDARNPEKGLGKLTHSELPYYAIAAEPPYFRDDRHAAIAEAAYYRAERRDFAPGHELEDWLAAEAQIEKRLVGKGRPA